MDEHMQGIATTFSNYWQKNPFFTWDMTLTNSTEADA
jgi:hypothetical protein